jgi:aerobic-type carbon monoxide dehydrogenase small subunit (CoxS/CutS family)
VIEWAGDKNEGRYDKVAMTVNGSPCRARWRAARFWWSFLRDHLRLTGTHVGCDTSQCGACVVHVDGGPVKACTALALDLQGAEVVTIEALNAPDGLALGGAGRRFANITACNAASARRA